jgi:hypothetical protein
MAKAHSVIVGTKFRGDQAMTAIAKMRPGDAVHLEREPDNAYDRNAVSCYYLGIHVGYIPRKVNPAIAQAMDKGSMPTARVQTIPLFSGQTLSREPCMEILW